MLYTNGIHAACCAVMSITRSAVHPRCLSRCRLRLPYHAPIFSLVAQDFYQALYTQSQAQFDTYVGSGTILNNYAHIFDVSRVACAPRLVASSAWIELLDD